MNLLARAALLPLMLAAAAAAAQSPRLAPRGDLPPVEGEVIVRFKPQAASVRMHALASSAGEGDVRSALAGRASALGQRTGRRLEAGAAVGERMQVVREAGADAAELARRLAQDPDVEFAEPNGRKQRLAAPNDPLYPATTVSPRSNGSGTQNGPDSGQWYLRAPDSAVKSAIDIEAAWARTRGNSAVVVAVLDTGVRFDHPDLTGRLLAGYDFVSSPTVANDGNGRDGDPSDPGDWVTATEAASSTFRDCDVSNSSWHGTATASLIGAATDNNTGMAGAAPGVRVLPVRVLGKCFGTDSDIQAAMRWAAGIPVPGVPDNPNPARVINMSLGSGGACGSYQAVVDEIVARGVMIVAAAGNSAGGPVGSPANCRGVVGVAALRHAGSKVGFSDLGPEIAIAAPGGNCINIDPGTPCIYPILAATNTGARGPVASTWTDSFDITVGTSFSSPLVAAVAGLMLTEQPLLTPAQVRNYMQSTARPFPQSGADNGSDPLPVRRCDEPNRFPGTDRDLQCYCTTALCGAGMLSAGAAVNAAASGSFAAIVVNPEAPVAGSAVNLLSSGSFVASGRTISSYAWSLVDGGGIVASLASTSANTSVTPSGAGTFRVRLTITDSAGAQTSSELSVSVAAVGGGGTGEGDAGGGGGALSWPWLALLAAAVLALRRGR
jgi:serine protease